MRTVWEMVSSRKHLSSIKKIKKNKKNKKTTLYKQFWIYGWTRLFHHENVLAYPWNLQTVIIDKRNARIVATREYLGVEYL